MTFYEFAEKHGITCESPDYKGAFKLTFQGRTIEGRTILNRKVDAEDSLHCLHLLNRAGNTSFQKRLKEFLGEAYAEFEDCWLG